MILSGIADEAGKDLATQIRAHKELGWNAIDLRTVDGKNVAGELSDRDFDAVADCVLENGMEVPCFASALGNWSRNITDDFAVDVQELKTAIPRMQRLGTKFIRTMSWKGEGVSVDEWGDETVRRYGELVKIAEDGDIYLAHENCSGWAALSAENTLRLCEEAGSDHVVALLDMGGLVAHGIEVRPFYEAVKNRIGYIHIKDCRKNPEGGKSQDYAYAGEGDGLVWEIMKDMAEAGYDGAVAIEPHVAHLIHDESSDPDPQKRYESYVEYGRQVTAKMGEIAAVE